MTVEDSVSIRGMRKSDFKYLESVFNKHIRDAISDGEGRGERATRRDVRISVWLHGINELLEGDCKIKKGT